MMRFSTAYMTKESMLASIKGNNESFFRFASRMRMKEKETGLVISLLGPWEPGVSL